MFVNSLFKDFLELNGLRSRNGESTRDIICLEFNYGTRSYEQELDRLRRVGKDALDDYRRAVMRGDSFLAGKARARRNRVGALLFSAHKNRSRFLKMSKDELRRRIYNEGISVEYVSRRGGGIVRKREAIHYRMLYRSTGKAKRGACMFICDRLYDGAVDFLRMGIELPADNAPVVEISAYASLVSSGIVGRVRINPENILIVRDLESFFRTDVVSVGVDGDGHCTADHIDGYELKNTLFDGQALIDVSLFPSWANGYVLLRHHFCKMAAFCTNIQVFFRDFFGDGYSGAMVSDMFGNMHRAADIELITTDNAMKWLKFGVSYEYWCGRVSQNGCMFGIVKTAHESRLGLFQKMSYQMVNSLDVGIMEGVSADCAEFVERLKSDNGFFLEYLDKNSNFSNDYDVLAALCRHNAEFVRSSYFRERKKKIIGAYSLKARCGEIIQNAENLTLVGSPYAMLLYAASGDAGCVGRDVSFAVEDGAIQCYTERFGDGEYLAGFRSPFNGKYNMSFLHNVRHDFFVRYFNFGRQVMAVNVIGTDFQDRNNGADFDSDFLYTTNQADIVAHARECYVSYPTIVNNIPKENNVYRNSPDDFAAMDSGLARSQADIGEASNLAQIAQTYACNFGDAKFGDYVCILSVLAQVAIDNAKRRFCVDLPREIRRIRNDMDIGAHGYPLFWRLVRPGFPARNINPELNCPMNYLYGLKFGRFRDSSPTLPMSYFFVRHSPEERRHSCRKAEELITKYSLRLLGARSDGEAVFDDYFVLRADFDELVRDLRGLRISGNYVGLVSWLLDRAFVISPDVARNGLLSSKLCKNRAVLMKALFVSNPDVFMECFREG